MNLGPQDKNLDIEQLNYSMYVFYTANKRYVIKQSAYVLLDNAKYCYQVKNNFLTIETETQCCVPQIYFNVHRASDIQVKIL